MATVELPPIQPDAPTPAPVVRPKSDSLDPEDPWGHMDAEPTQGEPPVPPTPPAQAAATAPAALLGVATGEKRPWWGLQFLRSGGLFLVAFVGGMLAGSPLVLEALGYKTPKDELEATVKVVVKTELEEAEKRRRAEVAEDLRRESEAHQREHEASDKATARELEALGRQVAALGDLVRETQRDQREDRRRR